jgi:hypothetical protein
MAFKLRAAGHDEMHAGLCGETTLFCLCYGGSAHAQAAAGRSCRRLLGRRGVCIMLAAEIHRTMDEAWTGQARSGGTDPMNYGVISYCCK